MGNKVLITGNQAAARGFYEGGGIVASSYPGSPTVEILEGVKEYDEIDSRFATNEKVALEIAIGASMAGGNAMVSMKHVGINIASDPFMTFTQVATHGGFVLVVGDDPGLSSSQNEQDSRFWAKYASCALLEPSNQQEVKTYVKMALALSREFGTPIIVRLSSRLCHSRGPVELAERQTIMAEGFKEDASRYCMLPPYANQQQYYMRERVEKLKVWNSKEGPWQLETYPESETLIITTGLLYAYIKELQPPVSILKLGMVWPLPEEKIKELSGQYKRIVVCEELMPFVEEHIKIMGIPCEGKEWFSFTGELVPDLIRKGLQDAGVIESVIESEQVNEFSLINRTPMMCSGCPHRPVFHLLKKAKLTVMGDIGCYSLGILEPFEVLKTNISMGASLGMAMGVSAVHKAIGKDEPIVAMIGDGTFFHSGLSGMVEIAKTQHNITVIVMDNRITAMTGGQETPTTAYQTGDMSHQHLNISEILKSFGISDITVVDQFQYKETQKIILDATKRPGLSVVVTTRPCALNFKIKEPYFYVDIDTCIGCRSCIGVNCPPISMEQYTGREKKNSYIRNDQCVGCSVCSQVCPVGAIKRSGEVE